MDRSIRPPNVEIRDTRTAKGIGVYAVQPLAQGEQVETCPVVIVAAEDFDALPKILRERLFDWSALIHKTPGQHALALGYGSIYNHANPANLKYFALRSTSTITFVANRVIEAGEELTINYDERGGFDAAVQSAWMKRNKVEPCSQE